MLFALTSSRLQKYFVFSNNKPNAFVPLFRTFNSDQHKFVELFAWYFITFNNKQYSACWQKMYSFLPHTAYPF